MCSYVTIGLSSVIATASQHDRQSSKEALPFVRQVVSYSAICPWNADHREAATQQLPRGKKITISR